MKIAVIGDLHYPSANGVNRPLSQEVIQARDEFFKQFIQDYFNIPADLYVSIGDLTNCGTQDELEEIYEIINSHNKNFKLTIGNHDLYTHSRQEVLDIIHEEVNVSIEVDEAILVFLETAREQYPERWDGTLSQDQMEWLDQVIEDSGDKIVIIFAHHPPYNTTAKSNHRYASIDTEIDLWPILNKKKGKGLYICGHVHTDSIVHKDQWSFVQISAVMDNPSSRIIAIQKDFIDITSIDLRTEKSDEETKVIGEALEFFNLSPLGVGTPLLQEAKLFF